MSSSQHKASRPSEASDPTFITMPTGQIHRQPCILEESSDVDKIITSLVVFVLAGFFADASEMNMICAMIGVISTIAIAWALVPERDVNRICFYTSYLTFACCVCMCIVIVAFLSFELASYVYGDQIIAKHLEGLEINPEEVTFDHLDPQLDKLDSRTAEKAYDGLHFFTDEQFKEIRESADRFKPNDPYPWVVTKFF